ncbi:hypothetical protein EIP86_011017 [Pleurotus ostreatoroseus]|nr:hypothetical protein EIP86_011017 [Pleurotus ostreatoroseus]
MDNQIPQLNISTVEFFSYRRTVEYPANFTGGSPRVSTDVPLSPVDPVARLTREYSALRLRLATAERVARPRSNYSQRSNQPDGIFAPPSSARTPPTADSRLGLPAETNTLRINSSYAASNVSATFHPPIQVNTSVQNVSTQPKVGTRPAQPNRRSPTKRRSGHQFGQNQGRRKQDSSQQQPKPPQTVDPSKFTHMKPTERCKQLERTLREVQDLLRERDREIDTLKKERDRLLVEREHDRKVMRDRELVRARERVLEQQREREREREREQERQKEREREKEREKERERERERQQDREQEERRRRFSSERNFRRARSQTPTTPTHSSYSGMNPDVEQVAQLRSLDVFMTKTDGWSGAQVIQAVEDLNAEITHFAASATEVCVFDRPPMHAGSRRSRRGRSRGGFANVDGRALVTSMHLDEAADIAPWLGPSFARILASRDHTQDPVLVQLALQASIATCCARSLSLFCVGFPAKLDGMLSRVFAHMQVIEPQPTSSRWRALTHRSIRSLYPGLEEYAVSELVTTMMRWSGTVFAVSGCRLPASDGKEKDSVTMSLRAQLRRIAEAVFKLARITREEILSTSFEVVLAESGQPFSSSMMSNALDEYRHGPSNGRSTQGNVLCTTELGLKCITRKGRAAGSSALSEEDIFERRVLLQPKVVLDSTVDALDLD